MSNPSTAKVLTPHTVQMDRRKQALITGVKDVASFHEMEIILKIEDALMVINGQNLHIGRLLLDDGRIDITGQIDSISYEKPRQTVRGIFKKRNQKQ